MQDNTFNQAKPLVERSTPKRERLSILMDFLRYGIVERLAFDFSCQASVHIISSVGLRLHTFFAACYIAGLFEWGENIEHTC
jgi:hypothetical protein